MAACSCDGPKTPPPSWDDSAWDAFVLAHPGCAWARGLAAEARAERNERAIAQLAAPRREYQPGRVRLERVHPAGRKP